mgnify:CR=1 FL=1
MSRKKKTHYSGIGGQAVLEGIMMKNKDQYAVAVRKPNGEIEVEVEHYIGVLQGSRLKEIPFIRGVFQFLDTYRTEIAIRSTPSKMAIKEALLTYSEKREVIK